jgi:ankyrin repeat protein
MAKRSKTRKLNRIQLFLLSAFTGALIATLLLLASSFIPDRPALPRLNDVRLVEAAQADDLTQVRSLLASNVSPDSTYGDGSAALHWATQSANLAMVQTLLAADANADIRNELGVTPLWLAAENGSDTLAQVLLEAGADATVALPSGETALMMAARSGNPALVEMLLAHGAVVNAAETEQQQTALMWAAAQRHPAVVAVLLANGADVSARSATWIEVAQPAGAIPAVRDAIYEIVQGGYTAFLYAAQQGDIAIARQLLAAGADVDDKAADGTTALVIAAHSGHSEFARFLLDNGADPNLAGAGYSALHIAIPHQDLLLVEALIAHGANLDAKVLSPTPARRDSRDFAILEQLVGTTPVWIAAVYRQKEILQALIDAGADTGFMTESRDTLLMLAIDGREPFFEEETRGIADPGEQERRALEMIAYTLELGIDINARNRNEDTALHKAAARGYDSIVRFLAENGAELEAVNTRGVTPLANALRLRGRGVGQSAAANESTAELLRSLGATL